MRDPASPVVGLLGALSLMALGCTEPNFRHSVKDASGDPSAERDAGGDMDGSAVRQDAASPSPDEHDGGAEGEDAAVDRPLDAGTDAAGDAALPADGGDQVAQDASTPACDAPCVCNPQLIGSLSGDTEMPSKEVERSSDGPGLVSVTITENDSSLVARDLTMDAVLFVEGGDYDLFLYAESLTEGCYGLSASSATTGNEWVQLRFPETAQTDDTRTVAIEVRPVSGTGIWDLTVRGNVTVP